MPSMSNKPIGGVFMKKIFIALFISLLVVSVGAQNAKKNFKNAKKMFESQLYQEALVELDQAITTDANYLDAYVLRAQVQEKLEHIEAAAADYEKAVSLDAKSVDYLYQAGRLNYQIKNYSQASKYLTEATTLDSKHFQAQQYKAFTHIKLQEFPQAIVAIDNALQREQTYTSYYVRGVANDSLKNFTQAVADYQKSISLNPSFQKSVFALAKCYLSNNQLDLALQMATQGTDKFASVPEAYEIRSLVYYKRGELLNAINDLSKLETLTDNAAPVLFARGKYYFEYGQFQNAKSDFSQLLAKTPDNNLALYWRGRANEEMMESVPAIKDYQNFITLVQPLNPASMELTDAKNRVFELNREQVPPQVAIDTPMIMNLNQLVVLQNAGHMVIKGRIDDKSDIESLTINGQKVDVDKAKTFNFTLDLLNVTGINLMVFDIYKNQTALNYELFRVETDIPIARITTPYASDNGEVYLDSQDQNLFVEGFIEDASLIKDIYVDDIRASFNDKELNPKFTATLSILNKDKITLKVVDAYNNTLETSYTLNREGALITEGNPMGKTWVVFIENSSYETFASLEGPTKDVTTMKSALANYEVHNFIHKKDMSKKEMERFFSIELRDQVKKNNVNSLLVWYAGHGKFINETGYWIPVDATRDDEFTYFNINSLKAGMQSYSTVITHTLVVTDACESGPSFYQAMRATSEIRSCDDVNATKFKSSQVFSSAGYELASDNSQFTKTFAKSLQFNENACLPIESIVSKVTEAVSANENQKPQFGKIAGFEDENGTFFFIKK